MLQVSKGCCCLLAIARCGFPRASISLVSGLPSRRCSQRCVRVVVPASCLPLWVAGRFCLHMLPVSSLALDAKFPVALWTRLVLEFSLMTEPLR